MSEFYNQDKYSGQNFLMPSRETVSTEDKRKPAYSKEVAQSVYSEFVKGKTWVSLGEYSTIAKNRGYSQGKQDDSRYRDSFLGKESKGISLGGDNASSREKRKAYANIDYTVMSPAPRIRSKIIGMLGDLVHRVSLDAIDSQSGAERESLKWGSYAEKRYGQKLNMLRGFAGIPQEKLGYIPDNVEELELFSAEDGFKLPYEAAMEDLLKFTFDISNWEEVVQDRVIGDLFENGFAIVKDRYDEATGKVKAVYCDIQNAGVQFTKQDEYDNADYGYDVEFRKISDVRQLVGADKEQQLFGLAKKFKGYYGNNDDDWSNDDYNQYRSKYGYQYDDYTVPVFNVAWKDVEYDEDVIHTNKYGAKRSFPREKKRLGKRDELVRTRRKTLYQCSWVIDTDIMLTYGVAPNQARDGLSNPALPYHCVKLPTAPIIPQIIPALDQFMFGWIKFQQGISMATPNGYSIDIGSISNFNLAGKKANPLEVIKMWRQTGILFRKDTNVLGKITTAGSSIIKMEGGAGRIFDESLQSMNQAMILIEQVTGINPVSLGASPSADAGKAVTEYSIAGTNDILKSMVKRTNILKSNLAKGLCLRLQFVVQNDKRARKGYEGVIGNDRLELLKIAEGNEVQYGIRTHARPDGQEKQGLIDAISMSLKNGRDGKVGITEADAVRFMSMVWNGTTSLKRIALMLAYANKKAKEEAEAAANRANELNSQLGIQAQQATSQMKQQEMATDVQSQIAKDNNKAKLEAGLEAMKSGGMSYDEYAFKVLGIGQQPQHPQQPQAQPQESALEEGTPIAEEEVSDEIEGGGVTTEV